LPQPLSLASRRSQPFRLTLSPIEEAVDASVCIMADIMAGIVVPLIAAASIVAQP
jgi:hypothetical protein